MGNICIDKEESRKQRTYTNTFSFIKSNSLHDSQFLGYLEINKLNQLLREVITCRTEPHQILQQLSFFYNQITHQLSELDKQNSRINKRLNAIREKVRVKNSQGYIIFEIQKIVFVEIPKQIHVQITTDTHKPSFKKRIVTSQGLIDTSSLFLESAISAKQILIKINEETCTLDLSQIKNQILVLQKLSIKNSAELLTIKGNIVVRIQYIQSIEMWKEQVKEKLSLKVQQIQTIMQSLQKLVQNNEGNRIQVLLKYLEESNEKAKESRVQMPPSSFYENEFTI